MNIKRIAFNKYLDRFVFRRVSPRLHSNYKLLRNSAYDGQRVEMYHRAAVWLALNGVTGAVCEFGCGGGESFLNLYFQFSRTFDSCPKFYLFDSFEGLPDIDARTSHSGWKKGDYSYPHDRFLARMDFYKVPRAHYKTVPGFYDETLRRENYLSLGIGPVALVHIDCDLYESTMLSMDFVEDSLQQGTVLLFDDYYCSRGHMTQGESGALDEWLSKRPEWKAVPWYDYAIHGKAFLVSAAT